MLAMRVVWATLRKACSRMRVRRLQPLLPGHDKPHVWDIEPSALRQFLAYSVDQHGHGCLNEPQRVLSGVVDERVVNTAGLPFAHQCTPGDAACDYLHAAGQVELQRSTQRHLSSCVVGVAHRPCSTALLLRTFFPWAADAAADLEHSMSVAVGRTCNGDVGVDVERARELAGASSVDWPLDASESASPGLRRGLRQVRMNHTQHAAVLIELTAAEREVYATAIAVHDALVARARGGALVSDRVAADGGVG